MCLDDFTVFVDIMSYSHIGILTRFYSPSGYMSILTTTKEVHYLIKEVYS